MSDAMLGTVTVGGGLALAEGLHAQGRADGAAAAERPRPEARSHRDGRPAGRDPVEAGTQRALLGKSPFNGQVALTG